MTLGVLATALAIPAGFTNDFTLIMVLLWFVLFFGGAIVPGATGLVLTSVPPSLRALSCAISMLTYNVFGYAAGSLVPGFYMDIFLRVMTEPGTCNHQLAVVCKDQDQGEGSARAGGGGHAPPEFERNATFCRSCVRTNITQLQPACGMLNETLDLCPSKHHKPPSVQVLEEGFRYKKVAKSSEK